ncbi:MAG: helix-turn-helix transcriptional regulator [Oceanicaulis sp.]
MDEFELLVAEEELIADCQMYIHLLMKESGVSKAELARLLGVSKASVSQMLAPDSNLTLRSIARVAALLGEKATICERKSRAHVGDMFEVSEERGDRGKLWRAKEAAEFAELSYMGSSAAGANDNYDSVWGFEELDIAPSPRTKPRLTAA